MILEWIIINRGLSVNLYFVYIFILKDYSYSSYQPIDTRLPDSYEFVCPTSWKGKTIDLKNLQFLTPLVYSPGNQEKLGRCFTTHVKIKLFKLQTQFKLNLRRLYRFLRSVLGDLSEEALPQDVQVVGDTQRSARCVPPQSSIFCQKCKENRNFLEILEKDRRSEQEITNTNFNW